MPNKVRVFYFGKIVSNKHVSLFLHRKISLEYIRKLEIEIKKLFYESKHNLDVFGALLLWLQVSNRSGRAPLDHTDSTRWLQVSMAWDRLHLGPLWTANSSMVLHYQHLSSFPTVNFFPKQNASLVLSMFEWL